MRRDKFEARQFEAEQNAAKIGLKSVRLQYSTGGQVPKIRPSGRLQAATANTDGIQGIILTQT